MKHFRISDNEGRLVAENLKSDCKKCFLECKSKGMVIQSCPIYEENRRQGIIRNNKSETFLCCDQTKTTKLFRDKLEALSYAFTDLIIAKKEIEDRTRKSEQQKVNRLVHNLTSINAHNIQEIYDLIPQNILSLNWRDQIQYIQSEIERDSGKAALMFLRLAKHCIHMKSEFSIYRKLEREDAVALEFKHYPIRIVILNVLHTFFADFSNNGIYVNVEDYFGKVLIDYETIQVAIYHMIENATKYAMPNSKISIEFLDRYDKLDVIFRMTSCHISKKERVAIFNEGISGENAKKMLKNGDGIGLWRIKQMMELNLGDCVLVAGELIENLRGFDFSENLFILKFSK